MNYLAPLNTVADRLRAQLPAGLPVRVGLDPRHAQDQSIGSPEVWVLFHRDAVEDSAGSVSCLAYQVAVAYVAPGILADLARDGETLTAITKALQGYEDYQLNLAPFKRVGPMLPQAWGDSMTAYGMLFETSFVL